jgi:hypothetical protein
MAAAPRSIRGGAAFTREPFRGNYRSTPIHSTELKGNDMADARCTCGFIEADDGNETIDDHLLAVFTPEDDKGPDGQVHLEGNPRLTCLCGFSASSAGELDSHFLEIFAPADRLDSGGVEHTVLT